jgi:hypothetical protein
MSAQRWSPVVDLRALPQPDSTLRGAIESLVSPIPAGRRAMKRKIYDCCNAAVTHFIDSMEFCQTVVSFKT